MPTAGDDPRASRGPRAVAPREAVPTVGVLCSQRVRLGIWGETRTEGRTSPPRAQETRLRGKGVGSRTEAITLSQRHNGDTHAQYAAPFAGRNGA